VEERGRRYKQEECGRREGKEEEKCILKDSKVTVTIM
jgi:hypothetical protein